MKKMIDLVCKVCGKEFQKTASQYRQDSKKCKAGKFCSKECFYKSPERSPCLGKKGKDCPSWKGGVLIERGYRMLEAQDHPKGILKGSGKKYVREHRLVVEKFLGRYLRDDECVHHINEDVADNRIENLIVMTNEEHNRYHSLKMHREKRNMNDDIMCDINGR